MNIKNNALDLCTTKRKRLFFFLSSNFVDRSFFVGRPKTPSKEDAGIQKETGLQKVQPQKKEKVIFVSCDIENEREWEWAGLRLISYSLPRTSKQLVNHS